MTERKQAEHEHLAHLHFFESMDQINQAMQSSNDLEQMMSNVLDVVLSIFNCDRAFLAVPCDPNVSEFKISMERTNPMYPGAFARGEMVPMTPAVRNLFQELLDNPAPNEILIGKGLNPDDAVWKTYEIKSQLAIALHPKVGKPWEFGLHQCSYNRVWTPPEKQLFREISRRLSDGLTSLLTYHNLQESEQRYKLVFENSPVPIWEEDFSEIKKLFDDLKSQGVNDIETYFSQYPETVQKCAELVKIVDVNQSALVLHEALTKKDLLTNLVHTFTEKSFETFSKELVCIWNGGTEMTSDAVVKTLNGKRRDVTVYFSVCPGYEDTLSKILVSLIDITERKQAVEAIRKQEQKFRSLTENSPDNIMRYNKDCQMIYANSQPQTSVGYDESIYTGKTPLESNPNGLYDGGREEIVNFEAALKSVLSGNGTTDVEMHTPDSSGGLLIHTVRLAPEYDIEGNIIGALAFGRDVTEQQEAEQKLKLLNFALNNVYEEVYLINEKACFDYVNDESCHVLGYSREKLLTMNVADIDPDFPLERWPEHWKETKKHSSLIFESRHKKNDGFIYPVEISANFFEYNGRGYILALARDITDRKQAEEALSESTRKLEEAQELAHLGFWNWDVQTGKVEWSKEIYKIFCLDPDTFTPQINSILDLSPWPEDHNRNKELINHALESHMPGHYEQKFLRPDNSIGYYYSTFQGKYDENGDLDSIVGICLDITERRLAEEALKESEWKYREIFDNVLDGLYLLEVTDDGHFRTIEVNPALEKITGVPRSFSVGKIQEETVPPEVAAIVNAKYRHCVEAGHPIEEEAILDLPSGKRYFHSTLIPARDQAGRIYRIIGISRDITEHKAAEEEIRNLNQELENRVIERTSQLEAANKELEAFAYSVSHDLRAPLRHIDGFIALLQQQVEKSLDNQGRHYMDSISESAKRMGMLIDDLLSFSRMGRQPLSFREVDIGALVRIVIDELKLDFAGRDISWCIGELPKVNGDYAMLQAVLMNLISNAIKFTGTRDHAEIKIGCRRQEKEIIVHIHDNGVGFDMKYADKLFNVFQRLHRQEDFEGTGIGLANVSRIINRHGGRVWAEAEPNRGAAFYFSLPESKKELAHEKT